MVERLLRDLTEKRIRPGIFRDVADLIMAVADYIDHHNRRTQTVHLDSKSQRCT